MTPVKSTVSVRAPFAGARNLPVSYRVDYEDGPVALSDNSRGLQYQTWTCLIVGDSVVIRALNTAAEWVIFSDPGVSEISFTFDQNALYTCAYVAAGVPKMRWYDSLSGEYVTTLLPPDCINPRVSLDEKRQELSGDSDVILAYVRGGNLYFRVQRERYTVEHLWEENVPAGLIKIGMNRVLRFQFALESG